jgi:hypothetical protein
VWGQAMKWLFKLFIPEHERKLVDMADKAVHINVYGRRYVFLDKHGNGFQFFTYPSNKSILTFMVDGTESELTETHYISFSLTQYLVEVADKVEADRARLREEEAKKFLAEDIDKMDARFKKD